MTTTDAQAGTDRRKRLARFGPRNISAIYLLVALVVVFSLWAPDTFPRYVTFTGIMNDYVVAGILALSLVLPLAVREFDISVGYNLGASSMLFAWLIGEAGTPVVGAIFVTMAFGLLVGLVNAFIVVGVGLESFIATLATGALLHSATILLSGGVILVNGLTETSWIAGNSLEGISHPVLYMVALTFLLWILLEHTAAGRRLLATGMNAESAHLAGLRTRRLKFLALVSSGLIASTAGIVMTAQVGAASPTAGPEYLIPAFAAVFLGSTQFKSGVVNGFGTLLAIVLLGTLTTGLALIGVPLWVPELVTGLVLIVAVALTRGSDLRAMRRARAGLRKAAADARSRNGPAEPAADRAASVDDTHGDASKLEV